MKQQYTAMQNTMWITNKAGVSVSVQWCDWQVGHSKSEVAVSVWQWDGAVGALKSEVKVTAVNVSVGTEVWLGRQ